MIGKSGVPRYFSKNYGFLETRKMTKLFSGIERNEFVDPHSLEDLMKKLLHGLALSQEEKEREELLSYAKKIVEYVERNRNYDNFMDAYYLRLKKRLEEFSDQNL